MEEVSCSIYLALCYLAKSPKITPYRQTVSRRFSRMAIVKEMLKRVEGTRAETLKAHLHGEIFLLVSISFN
jgi:hypothetical protein